MTRSAARTRAMLQAYYDRNTALFLWPGSAAKTGTIHRSLWPPEITALEEALNYSNGLLLREAEHLIALHDLRRIRMLDLGCGVGGSLTYLRQHISIPESSCGLTLSFQQARLARRAARGNILQADFHALPLAPPVDFAWSVESLVHSTTTERYFCEAARVLSPGGRLVVLDDILAANISPSIRQSTLLENYRHGWQAYGLTTLACLELAARSAGLHLLHCQNLTPLLRLHALPDFLTGFLSRLASIFAKLHPIVPSMAGSIALQQCLAQGLIQYQFLVFEKSPGVAA